MTPSALLTEDPRITEDPILRELCRRVVDQLVREGFVPPDALARAPLDGVASGAQSLEASVGRAVLESCRAAHALPRPKRLAHRRQWRRAARPGLARLRHSNRRPTATGRTSTLSVERRARLMATFAWVQNIGAVLILFAAWQVWGTAISEHHAQHDLAAEFAVHRASARSGTGHAAAPAPVISLAPRTSRLANPAEGTVMAHLQVPVIGLDQYVVSGTRAGDLARGPGHYDGTALPGQAGNVAIAGHRTTHGAPFYHLGDLTVGEQIILTTTTGEALDYYVSAPPRAVSPSDVSVLGDFGDNRLTLTTCTPPYSAAQRLVVVASLHLAGVPIGLEHLARTTPTPYRRLAAADTSSWGLAQLPLVAGGTLILLFLGLANRRLGGIYGRAGRWLVLTPIWVAALYVLFDSLTKLLPASV